MDILKLHIHHCASEPFAFSADGALVQKKPMNVEAFIDDRGRATEKAARPVGQGQHFEIAADDDIRLRNALQLGTERQRGLGDRNKPLPKLAVLRRPQIDRRKPGRAPRGRGWV